MIASRLPERYLSRIPAPARGHHRAALAGLAALTIVLTGCASTKPPAALPSIPLPSPTTPIPAPTGPALSSAMAARPHFLLSMAGNFNDFSVTAIEGQDLDDQTKPVALLGGAPITAGDALYSPQLSHHRSQVLFVEAPAQTLASSSNDGGGNVVVENVDGTGAKVIATGDNVSPAWSPDDSQIAFVRAGVLWLMNADGSDPHALGISVTVNYYLAWSPDGSELAVASGDPSQVEIVNLSTKAVTPVASASEEDSPAWSPDGRHLAFSEQLTSSLYLAPVTDGAVGTAVQLTTCSSPCLRDTEPAFSPDGGLIAFVRFQPSGPAANATGEEQVWVVPAAGGAPYQVTAGPQEHAFPSW